MKIKTVATNGTTWFTVMLLKHRILLDETHIDKNGLSENEIYFKIEKFIERYIERHPGDKKEVLQAASKFDDCFKEWYSLEYPRGGSRGGGRKKGTPNSTPKTNKTERINLAVTPSEKQAIIKFLNNMRGKGA